LITDDKRLASPREGYGVLRRSIGRWGDCKYCHHRTPQFYFWERLDLPDAEPTWQVLRCCWECGSGLEVVERGHGDGIKAAESYMQT
jgi:NAD-dependent dihydropyrimidine dehydrogenase PreA subunit